MASIPYRRTATFSKFGTRWICLSPVTREEAVAAAKFRERPPILVSAVKGEGLDALFAAIDQRLGVADEIFSLTIPPQEGRLLAWLHEHTDIVERSSGEEGEQLLRVRVASEKKERLMGQLRQAGIALVA